jgi:hypothetical protein
LGGFFRPIYHTYFKRLFCPIYRALQVLFLFPIYYHSSRLYTLYRALQPPLQVVQVDTFYTAAPRVLLSTAAKLFQNIFSVLEYFSRIKCPYRCKQFNKTAQQKARWKSWNARKTAFEKFLKKV